MEPDPRLKNYCFRCGECCRAMFRGMVVTYQEHDLIRSRTGVFLPHRIRQDRKLVLEGEKCPFLDQEKGCGIYEVRPCQCRIYHCGKLTPEGKRLEKTAEVRARMELDPAYYRYKERSERKGIAWGNAHGWNWRRAV